MNSRLRMSTPSQNREQFSVKRVLGKGQEAGLVLRSHVPLGVIRVGFSGDCRLADVLRRRKRPTEACPEALRLAGPL